MLRPTFIAIALLTAAPALADIAAIADGQPWTTTLPNGRSAQMTLNADGTGRMRFGLLSRSFTWSERDGAICLQGMPRQQGSGCLVPVATSNGYRMSGDGGEGLLLTR